MGDFENLKNQYEQGYRCIYSEKDNSEGLTMHLKNFREEKIQTMKVKNDMEIGKIEDYLQKLNEIKKKTGHDCHDL